MQGIYGWRIVAIGDSCEATDSEEPMCNSGRRVERRGTTKESPAEVQETNHAGLCPEIWRRGESNPRPKALTAGALHA